jgi:hypothetical protein
MAELIDDRLEASLKAMLRSEAASLPVTLRPEDVMRRARERRASKVSRPRPHLLAAALLVPLSLGLLVVGGAPREDEPAYRAVIVRGLESRTEGAPVSDLEVVLAHHDGEVETVSRVPAARFEDWASASYPNLSPSGRWLALGVHASDRVEDAQAIIDLQAPDAPARILPGPGRMGWAPDDTLWRAPNGPLEHIDLVTGRTTTIELPRDGALVAWSWAGPHLPVAADGSGAILVDVETLGAFGSEGEPLTPSWAVATGQGTIEPGTGVPAITGGPALRVSSADHGLIHACDSVPGSFSYCADYPLGTVLSHAGAGSPVHIWRGTPPADA